MKTVRFLLAAVAAAVVAGALTSCMELLEGSNNQQSNSGPKLGWETSCAEAGWASIPISDRVDYNVLYDDVVSLVSRKYEIEMLSKESGYIRTKWTNRTVTTTGQIQVTEDYRSKITIKLSPQRSKIEVNSEAEKMINGSWILGCDTRVLETIKQDLRGLSGY
ncbi:MAG: hypothetical protein LBC59_02760 [Chitinispirillales bacterium]|jgi:hypothetical protein|nr:hypothetical protein [Chitinispirillales bacterium]